MPSIPEGGRSQVSALDALDCFGHSIGAGGSGDEGARGEEVGSRSETVASTPHLVGCSTVPFYCFLFWETPRNVSA